MSANSIRSGGAPKFNRSTSSSSTSSSSSDSDNQLEGQCSSECSHCTREGGPLFCFGCGYYASYGRISKPCPSHPKVIFYTDFKACPQCKKTTIRELD